MTTDPDVDERAVRLALEVGRLTRELAEARAAVERVEAVRDRWTPKGLREAAIKHSLRAALDDGA